MSDNLEQFPVCINIESLNRANFEAMLNLLSENYCYGMPTYN